MKRDSEESIDKNLRTLQLASQCFQDFSDQLSRLTDLLWLAQKGTAELTTLPYLYEDLAELKGDHSDDTLREINKAKKDAELARRAMRENFPLLYAQSTITLWSALEAVVRLFLARWLMNDKEQTMKVEAIQKLRVRIGEYERLEDEERFFYILDLLEQDIGAPYKRGIERFESLLKPFGLSGPVDKSVRRDLFELQQIRNALVHRAGIADRRLVEHCPWLNLKVGDSVIIDRMMTIRHLQAVVTYSNGLLKRIRKYCGDDISRSQGE